MGNKNNKRDRNRASRLRKIVRLRDNFTCQSSICADPSPCPVHGKCYEIQPNDPRIKGKCSHQTNQLNPQTDEFQGYRKTNCPLQVHHIILYFKLKHRLLSLQEEADCCTLLCSFCHNNEHNNKKP